MQYTTDTSIGEAVEQLFYQDFKDTFVCNTQLLGFDDPKELRCFIRISKILLYAIHNACALFWMMFCVVLSGFQRYFCMQYTTVQSITIGDASLFYQDFNEQFAAKVQKK